jgi:hypothetical protein
MGRKRRLPPPSVTLCNESHRRRRRAFARRRCFSLIRALQRISSEVGLATPSAKVMNWRKAKKARTVKRISTAPPPSARQ